MSPKTDRQKSAKSATVTGKAVKGFTDEERAAMKERVQELKAEARGGPHAKKADGESDVLAKIAEMPKPDRAMAERLHAIITASAPALSPRTWYGMPAYAKDGNVVCFFQSAQKFKTRFAMLGFSDKANLDEGAMCNGRGRGGQGWPGRPRALPSRPRRWPGSSRRSGSRSAGRAPGTGRRSVASRGAGTSVGPRWPPGA